jgi:hypothetical protein
VETNPEIATGAQPISLDKAGSAKAAKGVFGL